MPDYYWQTPSGTNINLQSDPYLVLDGMSGHLMPPFRRSEKWQGEVGFLDGLSADARDVFLPLLVRATDIDSAMRTVASIFNPLRGDGYLRVVQAGSARRLKCRYAGGLEGGERGAGWCKVGVRLRSLEPYWEAEAPAENVYTVDPPVMFFSAPFLPLRISDSTIDVSPTIMNGGDVETWPIYTISGRARYILIRDSASGKRICAPSLAMEAGDVITIDARRNRMTITLNGQNAFGLFTGDTSFFSLLPGENNQTIVVDGAEASSSVVVAWYERYLTA